MEKKNVYLVGSKLYLFLFFLLHILKELEYYKCIFFFSNGYLSAEEVELSKSELSKTFPDGIPASGADALRWALLR